MAVIVGTSGNDLRSGTGAADTLLGYGGDDTLFGLDGPDEISGNEGNDSLDGGNGDDRVFGQIGHDFAEGGPGADLLTGEEGNDTLQGGADNDNISGQAGDDVLRGGAGEDLLAGNEGNDQHFGDAGNDQLYGHDGNDTSFGGDGQDTLAGDEGNDQLYGNAGNDDIAGGVGNDGLDGGDGSDSLNGGLGDDTLNGGAGADSVLGGSGNDLLYIDSAADIAVELTGEGFDRLLASFSYTLQSGSEIEVLSTDSADGTAAINLTGNNLDNTILGNAGDNVLDGGEGADALYGLGGNDIYLVDSAADAVIEAVGGGADRVSTTVSYSLQAGMEIETLNARNPESGNAIDLSGNEIANTLQGNAGENVLNGGAGADLMYGLGGNDLYFVDSAADVVIETAGGGSSDRIATGISYSLQTGTQVEILSATDPAAAISLSGNEIANTLYANDAENVLNGGAGADFMIGLGGNDLYFVESAGDTVLEAAGGGTSDRVATSVSYALQAGSAVELVTTIDAAGTGAINLSGNELANAFYANAGDNVLNGGGGADWLQGQGGNDLYFVDNIADTVIEGAGEGASDRVAASVSYTLQGGVNVETLSTTDAAGTEAINLTGNEVMNTISGNAGANILNGGGAADAMSGFGGNDLYFVDNAGDTVAEAAGGGSSDQVATSTSYTLQADAQVEVLSTTDAAAAAAISLIGNAFANTLYANAGSNVLDGKGGADWMYGLGGADAFQFSSALGAGNVDEIVDFTVGQDSIRLAQAVFSVLPTGALAAAAFHVGAAAADTSDRIIYNSATGNLSYDVDGSGGTVATVFAHLGTGLGLSSGDFLIV